MLGKKTPKLTLADAERGLDELTAIYVGKYVEALNQQMERVGILVADVSRRLDELDAETIDSVNVAQLNHTSQTLAIKARVVGSTVEWDEYETVVVATLMLEDLDDITGSMRTLGKYRRLPVAYQWYVRHTELQKELASYEGQLLSIGLQISGVDAKQEEIRLKLLEIRLRDTDLADLVDHPEVNDILR